MKWGDEVMLDKEMYEMAVTGIVLVLIGFCLNMLLLADQIVPGVVQMSLW